MWCQLNGPPVAQSHDDHHLASCQDLAAAGREPALYRRARCSAPASSPAAIITWVGKDEQGSWYIQAMEEAGLPTEGVARTLPGRSPVCIMAYDPTGASYCLYEAGNSRGVTLDPAQLEVIIRPTGFACAPSRRPPAARRSRISSRTRS